MNLSLHPCHAMPRLQIYAAGSNSHGQLGIGNEDDAHTFVKCDIEVEIQDVHSVKIKICTGANHTLLFVCHGGIQELLVAGSSRRGQLGQISEDNKLSFEPLPLDYLAKLFRDKGSNSPDQDWLLKDVAAAWETSFFLLEDRKTPMKTVLLACGSNDLGQLGVLITTACLNIIPLPSGVTISRVSSGPRHTIAVIEEGHTVGWGASRHGQLGEAVIDAITYTPTRLDLPGVTIPAGDTTVALGNQHTCVVNRGTTESLVIFGSNRKGQLATSDMKARKNVVILPHAQQAKAIPDESIAVSANWNTTLVLDRSADILYSFGNNASGQLGRESHTTGDIGKVDFGGCEQGSKILQVASGSEHTLAILEDVNGTRELWGWGWNEHGNLGRGRDALQDVRKPVLVDLPGSGMLHSVHAGNGTSWIGMVVSDELFIE